MSDSDAILLRIDILRNWLTYLIEAKEFVLDEDVVTVSKLLDSALNEYYNQGYINPNK